MHLPQNNFLLCINEHVRDYQIKEKKSRYLSLPPEIEGHKGKLKSLTLSLSSELS